jgi:hypothetical protein
MIHVRIFHGSIAKPFRGDRYRELGGFFGGHVAVQIDDRVYGFFYADRQNIHLFPQPHNKSSVFQNQSLAEWEALVAHKKETIISIPVNDAEKQHMLQFYERNLAAPEWDYSFWGERCASNCFRLLADHGKVRKGSRFLKAFFPQQLLRTLRREAKKRGYTIRTKAGDPRRFWI